MARANRQADADEAAEKQVSGVPGKLTPPYGGVERCAGANCRVTLTEETEAFLHSNRETGKLVVFCGGCSLLVQMNMSLRFPLVSL